MSQIRQRELFGPGASVRGLAATFPDSHRLPAHAHPWAQLVYAASGVMQVSTPDAAWLVPPTRAIWLPAGVRHAIRMRGAVAMRTLYLAPSDRLPRPEACRALEVAPLLRELVLHIVRLDTLEAGRPEHERLEALLLDLLAAGETAALELPLPRDARARAFADRILARPGCELTAATLARDVGASLRTLQRLFQTETGLPLDTWRGRARMQQAVVALSGGRSVTEAGLEAGYQSTSAFIAAFKRVFGVTPARYRAA